MVFPLKLLKTNIMRLCDFVAEEEQTATAGVVIAATPAFLVQPFELLCYSSSITSESSSSS